MSPDKYFYACAVTQVEGRIVFALPSGLREDMPHCSRHGQALAVVRLGMPQDLRRVERLRQRTRIRTKQDQRHYAHGRYQARLGSDSQGGPVARELRWDMRPLAPGAAFFRDPDAGSLIRKKSWHRRGQD